MGCPKHVVIFVAFFLTSREPEVSDALRAQAV